MPISGYYDSCKRVIVKYYKGYAWVDRRPAKHRASGPLARSTPSQWTAPRGTPSQWPASPPDPSCKLAKNKLTPSPTHKPPSHKTPRHATCPQLRRAPRWGVAPAKKRLWRAPRRGCENHALCHHKIFPQKNVQKTLALLQNSAKKSLALLRDFYSHDCHRR